MSGILSFAFALLAAAAASAEAPRDITVDSLLSEINRQRLVHRLPPLRLEPRLVRAAELRMRDMEEQRYWAHVDPNGNPPFECPRVSGYDFELAGENLAQGFESPQVLVEAWMESEGHRRNLLAPRYSEAGVAVIDGGTTRRTTGKSVVVVFARERDPRLMPNPRKMPDTP